MTGVALVTGASRGIGRATAAALVKAGFTVAMNGLPGDDELASAVATVGSGAMAAPFDVSDIGENKENCSNGKISSG